MLTPIIACVIVGACWFWAGYWYGRRVEQRRRQTWEFKSGYSYVFGDASDPGTQCWECGAYHDEYPECPLVAAGAKRAGLQ